MEHEIFNAAAIEIWKKHYGLDEDVYVPLILPPIVRNGLLFVGLNPSFSPDGSNDAYWIHRTWILI